MNLIFSFKGFIEKVASGRRFGLVVFNDLSNVPPLCLLKPSPHLGSLKGLKNAYLSSSAYPEPGRGGSRLSRDAQTSLSPDTSSSSSGGSPRRSQASRET
ncbi:hypothetical protein ATANTOWER_030079 [Ataeniobius toweri]|uniref:Uncharacterized protein n=1 Tax=Ataeniobius toweri TaxID=208326 RepID=A0ABU7ASL2_9TELE|nr:hypothetical protein [Ataeniobius toweri]